jgi:hypothetical protein
MKMMQGGDDAMPASPVKLQVNQRHPIIKGLSYFSQSRQGHSRTDCKSAFG